MYNNKNQADTEIEKKVKNAHSLDCTPPRVRSLRGDGGEKFDTDQKHQPETV